MRRLNRIRCPKCGDTLVLDNEVYVDEVYSDGGAPMCADCFRNYVADNYEARELAEALDLNIIPIDVIEEYLEDEE